jgi:hypothetical protein
MQSEEISSFSLSSIVASLVGDNVEKGYLRSCGIWVNAQLVQIVGGPVSDQYSESVRDLIVPLVRYYIAERGSNGRIH